MASPLPRRPLGERALELLAVREGQALRADQLLALVTLAGDQQRPALLRRHRHRAADRLAPVGTTR